MTTYMYKEKIFCYSPPFPRYEEVRIVLGHRRTIGTVLGLSKSSELEGPRGKVTGAQSERSCPACDGASGLVGAQGEKRTLFKKES